MRTSLKDMEVMQHQKKTLQNFKLILMNTIWHRKPNLSEIKKMSKKTIDEYLGIEITEVGDDFLLGKYSK